MDIIYAALFQVDLTTTATKEGRNYDRVRVVTSFVAAHILLKNNERWQS